MKLFLHRPDCDSQLSSYYQRACANAVELFIVTAFLTEWDTSLELNPSCRFFRVIIGKDFGITRKSACEKVMRWLPAKRKGQFLVADQIGRFHPKAVFWTETTGNCFAIIGSSNLTNAAFETNYEANVYCRLSKTDYFEAKQWVNIIEKQSVVVSEDWLKKYKEAPLRGGSRPRRTSNQNPNQEEPLVALKLPRPKGMKQLIVFRRGQLMAYEKKRAGLTQLFRRCASGEISSDQFYQELPKFWSHEIGDRLQWNGWERKGRSSNFQVLSRSFLRIIDAPNEERDDVIVEEIDNLRELRVPSRRAFLSEMLCLRFPAEYPVDNKPVHKYLKETKFKAPRGASEGVKYIDLARKLRLSLTQNPNYPAKNIAELDSVIWLKYGN